jgi:hypothetical protein
LLSVSSRSGRRLLFSLEKAAGSATVSGVADPREQGGTGQFKVTKVTTRQNSRTRRHIHRRSARRPRWSIVLLLIVLLGFGGFASALFLGLNVIVAGQADLPKLADQQR